MKHPALCLVFGALLTGCPEVPAPQEKPPSYEEIMRMPAPGATSSASAEPRSSGPEHKAGERIQLVEKAMGTRIVLAAYTTQGSSPAQIRKALAEALAEIRRIERLMTTWQQSSEVSKINAAAGQHAVAVSDETLGVISKSLWISKRSEGTFDITFASIGKLWKFDEDKKPEIPSKETIEKARKLIDYRKVQVDAAAKTVMLKDKSTQISLGGIAKGYAIDRAAAVLRKAGLRSFFAQAGGDLYVEGVKPSGEPWRVGIRDPRGADGTFFALLPVTDHAFSTAGDYERAMVKDGKRYHHIIDPRTGSPATACRSVTIWAKDALTADAIDDAVFILGPKKGLALVESLDDTGAVIVDANNRVWVSKRLEGLVQFLRLPSGGI